MSLQPPVNERQAFVEFDFTLPTILSGPSRPFPKELAALGPLADVRKWIHETFEHGSPQSALRRFLAGEFTGGQEPYRVGLMHVIHIEKMLRVLDFIEGMAKTQDIINASMAGDLPPPPDESPVCVEFPCDSQYFEKPDELVTTPAPPSTPQSKRGCSVEGCGLAHCAKGFCRVHYQKSRLPKRTEDAKPEPALVGTDEGVT